MSAHPSSREAHRRLTPRRRAPARAGRVLVECLVSLCLAATGSALLASVGEHTVRLRDRAEQLARAEAAARAAAAEAGRDPCAASVAFTSWSTSRLAVHLHSTQAGGVRRTMTDATWLRAGVGAHARQSWRASTGTRCE